MSLLVRFGHFCAIPVQRPVLVLYSQIVTADRWLPQPASNLFLCSYSYNHIERLHGYDAMLARVFACRTVTACRFVTVRRTRFLIVYRRKRTVGATRSFRG